MSDLVGNPEDRFSRVAAHILCYGELIFFQTCPLISPEYNINIFLIISPNTGQGAPGTKSHHQEWAGMKHAKKPMDNYILVLNPRWKVPIATDFTLHLVIKVWL